MTNRATLIKARLTEKATAQGNRVHFEVDVDANKHQIRDAVTSRYKVDVTCIRTMIVPGKLKRRGQSVGKRPNWKKAIVTLGKGQAIDFLAAE